MWVIYGLLILLLLILLIVLWILFARIMIYLNSDQSLYYLEVWGLFRMQLKMVNGNIMIQIDVPFKTFEFDLLEEMMKPKEERKREEKEKPKKRKKKKGRFKIKKGFREIVVLVFKLIRSIHRSFQVERFYVNIDTGNFPMNAKLIPLFQLINWRTRMRWDVNFRDRNSVDIIIKNRLIRIIVPIAKTVIRLYK